MHQSIKNIKEYLDIFDEDDLNNAIRDLTITEILDQWDEFTKEEMVRLFTHVDQEFKVGLISEIPTQDQETILIELSASGINNVLSDMEPDDLVDLIQQISPDVRQSVWDSLPNEVKEETEFLLKFDEDDAAGLMTPRYAAIRKDITVSQAINFIRKRVEKVETIYYLYVVDEFKKLVGVISLKEILTSEDNVTIDTIMERHVLSAREDTDQEHVVKIMEDHDLLALPVINRYNKLLGIITIDDAIDVMREEQTEDVYKMGAMSGDTDSYLESGIFKLILKRIPWLIILLLAGTASTNVIAAFSDVTSMAFVILFMGVITQTGGNCGTQSSTLMIRGLATGEIHFRDFFKIIRKELLVGSLIGLVTGIIIILRSFLLPPGGILIQEALTIGLSLNFVVIFATIIGASIPLTLHKIGLDPTVAAGPLMSTVIDVCGYAIYFTTIRLVLF
ncbi:magnesium transporter [Thiospirochaeta perfilievii]|uniref:Magnesium transporter MgtE n=1 Tax=Thiospirochaeta perfilievii TaxID=252967 RepID=A0A5C1Q6G9_9SPIO|nr:magnesium transporter [Thiospirochaeta perfilievii]QEN03585.1 magnesium transporter [Thiospirochaeta perfilievii]